jgi:hypothetical protein
MKRKAEVDEPIFKNAIQVNIEETGNYTMKKDTENVAGKTDAEYERVCKEFDSETCEAFGFDTTRERKTVIQLLEELLLGASVEDSEILFTARMAVLVELFKEHLFEPELRYWIWSALIV